MLLVSLAGPATNFIIAVIAAILLGAFFWDTPYLDGIVSQIISINIILAVFNLLPIPPLDGSKILAGLIPGTQEWLYKFEQYGMIVLILLMVTGIIGKVLGIFISPLFHLMSWLAYHTRDLF